jgi:hypothetical protein
MDPWYVFTITYAAIGCYTLHVFCEGHKNFSQERQMSVFDFVLRVVLSAIWPVAWLLAMFLRAR